jgi:single-strand DNA-binding protein
MSLFASNQKYRSSPDNLNYINMSSYNKAIIMGRLTADPVTKQVGGTSLCTFSIAVNKRTKDDKKVLYWDCEAWRDAGEYIAKYAKKGDNVYFDADLDQDIYEDKEGKSRKKVKLNVKPYSFGFCAGNAKGEDKVPTQKVKVPSDIDDEEDAPF